jgi:dihydrofolate synthase/folylpolyglutamate synthase
MQTLLDGLGSPHQAVPIIHVAGTNGKGSVCAYLSSVLTQAGYRVGRYTSPHLVDWMERICVDNQAIPTDALLAILYQINDAIHPHAPSPTQFEVITTAAWLYFAQQAVDVAVIEVGLGGRLDATNVCDRPLVSVITSISRDHWQRLGPTLADIAGEKAGILKPGCPAIIGELPPSAEAVVKERVAALNCPALWVKPAQQTSPGYAQSLSITYPLPLAGHHQLMNSALAIATLQELRHQGWSISDDAIHQGMQQTRWLGRIQWVTYNGYPLLIDGAHNAAAAATLRAYVDECDRLSKPIHWVMGMLSTKDHADIFKALLREGDRLSLVPVPDHSSADPEDLRAIAYTVCPSLNACHTYTTLFEALQNTCLAQHDTCTLPLEDSPSSEAAASNVVLCGSLYLVGYFLKHVAK